MPRLQLHAKLLLAFGIVLLPILALLCADFFSDERRTQETLLDSQSMTAQAIAVQIAESFESAIEFGRAVAHDPLVQGMDPSQLWRRQTRRRPWRSDPGLRSNNASS
jgi:hypothetical protein